MKLLDWVICIAGRPSYQGGPNPGEVFQIKSTWINSYGDLYLGLEVPTYRNNASGDNLLGIRVGAIPNWKSTLFRLLTEEELHTREFYKGMDSIINE